MDPESINGLNLYAYCNNDPVNKYDPDGHDWYNVLWDWANIIAGLLNPISTLTAAGAIIASACNGNWSGLVDDYNAGRLNPFNQDAKLAGDANVLSFYKGSTVINQNIVSTCSAFGTIWKVGVKNAETIMHEYGHSVQERILGPAYWTNIAIPSMLYFEFGSNKDIDYFSTPWERTADLLGGVIRKSGYKKDSIVWAVVENLLGPVVIPFYFIFGY